MSDMRTSSNHSKNDSSTDDSKILITKSSSSSVVWRIYGVLPGAALTPPVDSMSEMGSNIPVTLIPKSEI